MLGRGAGGYIWDMDTSIYGSGFPCLSDPVQSSMDPELWHNSCKSPLNLNNFPNLEGSILPTAQDKIADLGCTHVILLAC